MIVTKDPRCPEHHDYAVDIGWRRGQARISTAPGEWRCSVCDRPLGLPRIAMSFDWRDARIPFPQGRRKTRVDAQADGKDWDWLIVHGFGDQWLTPHDQFQRKARGQTDEEDWMFRPRQEAT